MPMTDAQAARWERTLHRGMAWFVIKFALTFTIALSVTKPVVDYLFDGQVHEFSWLGVLFYLSFGTLTGFVIWQMGQSDFKKYQAKKQPGSR